MTMVGGTDRVWPSAVVNGTLRVKPYVPSNGRSTNLRNVINDLRLVLTLLMEAFVNRPTCASMSSLSVLACLSRRTATARARNHATPPPHPPPTITATPQVDDDRAGCIRSSRIFQLVSLPTTLRLPRASWRLPFVASLQPESRVRRNRIRLFQHSCRRPVRSRLGGEHRSGVSLRDHAASAGGRAANQLSQTIQLSLQDDAWHENVDIRCPSQRSPRSRATTISVRATPERGRRVTRPASDCRLAQGGGSC